MQVMPVNSATVSQPVKRRLETMPSTMTMPPKKKRDFFNGSQGLDPRDFRSPEPQEVREEGASAVDERRASGSYTSTPPGGVSLFPPGVMGHPPGEVYAYHDRRSTAVGYHRLGEPERCPISPAFTLQSRGLDFDDSAPLAEAPAPYPSSSAAESPRCPDPSAHLPSTSDGDGSGEDGKKAKKRKQRCRLCANHGIYVEMKGHKWYCPYKNPQHSCPKCENTRQRQFFSRRQFIPCMKELEPEEGRDAAAPPTFPSQPSDFPRMRELLEETDQILDEELFRQIDECVRPKVTHH